ncbi:hypothetical protein BDY19DRAFT_235743 [Irpex rosettiformis]|uniref:Uncharacterized protein n=1 Tax=Irpex rosettiformis TaxID=378272 RepID=A0ACB8TZW9_9APHY|nr:hypothetical protein BDY19DRAFT_235743 [Irpex rosettiformis]
MRDIKQLMTWIFGVTPNSMSDERTASYFTWQNSHLRGSQQVSTLVRMAQIRQYSKMSSPDSRVQLRRPTVRFRDLKATLRLNQDQRTSSSTQATDASTAGVESSSDESDSEIAASSSDSESEDDGDVNATGMEEVFDWDTAQTVTRPRRPYDNEPSNRLVIEEIANLGSRTLRDLLSDEPLAVAPKPPQPPAAPIRTQPRKLQESDWSL